MLLENWEGNKNGNLVRFLSFVMALSCLLPCSIVPLCKKVRKSQTNSTDSQSN